MAKKTSQKKGKTTKAAKPKSKPKSKPKVDDRPLPQGTAVIETMNEEDLVDEIVRLHNVPKYRGRKVDTSNWLKIHLKNLCFACRGVLNSAYAHNRVMKDMAPEAIVHELQERAADYPRTAKRPRLEQILQEYRVRYAMVELGYEEWTEEEKLRIAEVSTRAKPEAPEPDSTPEEPENADADADTPEDEPETASTEKATEAESSTPAPAPKSKPITRLELADIRRHLVDEMMTQVMPESVCLDLLVAFRENQPVQYQIRFTMPGNKQTTGNGELHPPKIG